MPGITQNFVKGMVNDGYDYLFETYDALEEIWPQLFAEKSIDGDYWQETTVVNSGTWRKTSEAEGFQAVNITEGFTVYGAIWDYTQAVSFSNRVMADHQKVKNILKESANGWGTTAKETREEFYSGFFNKGGLTAGEWRFNGTPESKAITDSSGDLVYDSKPFFNLLGNERSSKGGGTYYNGFALALDGEHLKTVRSHILSKNKFRENDTRFALTVDTLLVPSELSDTAIEVLNSTLVPYKSTNTTNVLKGKLNPVEWAYLTDPSAWFVGKSKNGIVALKRQEPKINFFQDELGRKWWATAELRIGAMIKNWRFWGGSQFSTS